MYESNKNSMVDMDLTGYFDVVCGGHIGMYFVLFLYASCFVCGLSCFLVVSLHLFSSSVIRVEPTNRYSQPRFDKELVWHDR
jgi:hypothetical protein